MDMERRYFTTHETAQLLGVSLPTIINWVNAGRLQAHRTPGGHRRIDRDSIVTLIRRHGLPMPDCLAEEGAAASILILGGAESDLSGHVSLVRRSGLDARTARGMLEIGFALGRLAPDALLFDLDSLGARAFSALSTLRESGGYAPPPVFGIGNGVDDKTLKRAGEAGFQALFRPDVEPAAFRQRVELAFRQG